MTRQTTKGARDVVRPTRVQPSTSFARAIDRGRRSAVRSRASSSSRTAGDRRARVASTCSIARDAAGHRARVRRHTSTTRGDSDGEGRCSWDDAGGRARGGAGRARGRCSWGRGRRGRDAWRGTTREVATRGKSDAGAGLRTAWTNYAQVRRRRDVIGRCGVTARTDARRRNRRVRARPTMVSLVLFLNFARSRAITGAHEL